MFDAYGRNWTTDDVRTSKLSIGAACGTLND
jgi:hypothetical protein